MINTIIIGGQYTNPDENLVDVNLCRNCQNNEKYDSMDICYECSDDFDEHGHSKLIVVELTINTDRKYML